MIPEAAIRSEFKACILTEVKLSKCYNCGDVIVAFPEASQPEPNHDGALYHWCHKCTIPMRITSTPVVATVRKLKAVWIADDDTRIRHYIRKKARDIAKRGVRHLPGV